ncbi:glycosyltransferase [Bacillus aerolatus]|uniref:Glycosyltransferase n=1 Tax=Bacillus aerolatus TaxID=2653354 RepID=A0A6I1FRW2_9BACI|nr:glycosyltransferase [Bacillus aerolatus]KAB7707380.1 glycosyltransferase [Bacillus aerolatus]
MKITFLLSHFPDPRFVKRIKVANKVGSTQVVYAERPNNVFNSDELVEVIGEKNILRSEFSKSRILFLLTFMFTAFNNFNREKPNKIHVGNLDMLFIVSLYKFLFSKNVEVIYEVADLHKYVYNDSSSFKANFFRKFLSFLEKKLLKNVDSLILTSPYFWEDYYQGKIDKEKYILIPNVPDEEYYKDITPPKSSEFRIGFIGVVRYKQQLINLLNVCKRKNVKVMIAGDGPDYISLKNEYLENDNISFFGKYDYKKDIKKLYESVDIIYSVYDTKIKNVRVALPNKLYEAIVSERPIIVAKDTKLSDCVSKLEIGYNIDASGEEDLEKLFDFLLINPNDIADKSNNCKSIKNQYFFSHYSNILKSIYSK